MKQIDYQDPRPIYEQISEYYKTLILKGIMEADEQMPSVRQLAMECSTNPNTVQRAYAELERQGFIYTVKGRGNFVKGGQNLLDDRKAELARRLLNTIQEAESLGIPREELIRTMQALEDEARVVAEGTAQTRAASDTSAGATTAAAIGSASVTSQEGVAQ